MPEYLAPGVYVEEVLSAVKPIAGVGTSTAGFIGIAANIRGPWDPGKKTGMPKRPTDEPYEQAPALTPQFVTSWTEFTQKFGEIQASNQYLAHAVYGFFNNGGTRCWVARLAAAGDLVGNLDDVLEQFEAKDEIAIVAAPLPPDLDAGALNAVHAALVAHCERMEDRVAVLDSTRDIAGDNLQLSADAEGIWRPSN